MKLTYTKLVFSILAAALFSSATAQSETVVTTYVTKVQEERKSTRWTLTEWLRIKERMKLMDVWLAMFSSPQKPVFSPELYLSYGLQQGSVSLDGTNANEKVKTGGSRMQAQLYLTNLFSGTVGMSIMNMDLGLEAYQKNTTPRDKNDQQSTLLPGGDPSLTHYGLNLRVFGKNIQDSSLVLKYGAYTFEHALSAQATGDQNSFAGRYYGGELQVYLIKALGLLVDYHSYMKGDNSDLGDLTGSTLNYSIFAEVSLFRIFAGYYTQDFSYEADGGSKTKSTETGTFAGARLQF